MKEHWTESEIKILKENHDLLSTDELKNLLPTRTCNAIVHKRERLGLQGTYRNKNGWNANEDNILYEAYPSSPKEIILNWLYPKTWQGIKHRASDLNISRKEYFSKYISQIAQEKVYVKHIGDKRARGKNHPKWRGGVSIKPYGLEFNNKLRKTIRKRDRFTCQTCGRGERNLEQKLDVHHIDSDKKSNNLSNLVSLCKSCHAKIHAKITVDGEEKA